MTNIFFSRLSLLLILLAFTILSFQAKAAKNFTDEKLDEIYKDSLQEIESLDRNSWEIIAKNNNLDRVDVVKNAINNISGDQLKNIFIKNEQGIKNAIPHILNKKSRRDYQFTDVRGAFSCFESDYDQEITDQIADKISLYIFDYKNKYQANPINDSSESENESENDNFHEDYYEDDIWFNVYYEEIGQVHHQQMLSEVQGSSNNYTVEYRPINNRQQILHNRDQMLSRESQVLNNDAGLRGGDDSNDFRHNREFIIEKMLDFNYFISSKEQDTLNSEDLSIGLTNILSWHPGDKDITKTIFANVIGRYNLALNKKLLLKSKSSLVAGTSIRKEKYHKNSPMLGCYLEYELTNLDNKDSPTLNLRYNYYEEKSQLRAQATLPIWENMSVTFESSTEFLRNNYDEAKTTIGFYLNTKDSGYIARNYFGYTNSNLLVGLDLGFNIKDNRFFAFCKIVYPIHNTDKSSITDIGTMFQIELSKYFNLNGFVALRKTNLGFPDALGALNFTINI
ncbi:MAG: hypothetical protein K9G11_00015 [Rickettsiaceae bacterium]|nr:hypothetical protein [Rickettsiaceae bacterium]